MEVKRKRDKRRIKEEDRRKKEFLHLPTVFLIPIFCFLSLGWSNSNSWIESLPKPWTMDEDQVSEILPQFYEHFPNFHDRLKAFALWQVGKPYEIFIKGDSIRRIL